MVQCGCSFTVPVKTVVMDERKFWLFDSNPEGEIYENLSWDLPGYQLKRKTAPGRTTRRKQAKGRLQP
jgi:hypothetical protein